MSGRYNIRQNVTKWEQYKNKTVHDFSLWRNAWCSASGACFRKCVERNPGTEEHLESILFNLFSIPSLLFCIYALSFYELLKTLFVLTQRWILQISTLIEENHRDRGHKVVSLIPDRPTIGQSTRKAAAPAMPACMYPRFTPGDQQSSPLHKYEKKGLEVEEIDPGVATRLPGGVSTAPQEGSQTITASYFLKYS